MNNDFPHLLLNLLLGLADRFNRSLEKGNFIRQDIPVIKPPPVNGNTLIKTQQFGGPFKLHLLPEFKRGPFFYYNINIFHSLLEKLR